MKVALDARLTRQMSIGMKTYARELTARLPIVAPEFTFIPFPGENNFDWSEQIALPLGIRRAGVQLTHYLAHYLPVFAPRPFIVTIHDLIHLRFPQFYKSKVGPYYNFAVRRACANAARVITDDPRTVEDLEHFLGVNPAKVRVIPLGVGPPFTNGVPTIQVKPNNPYLLYVGNHRAHKDLPTLFAAWSLLPERFAIDLYVTGPDDFDGELQRRSAAGNNAVAGRRVIALGDLDDMSLREWYRGAVGLVHPALCEGFGLPLLEAMASGCPVVVSAGAVPSVLERGALVFPTQNVEALHDALLKLLRDEGLRLRLVNEGSQLASILTWDRCARATADVYGEVLGEGRSAR